jgi:hypothetical protein
MNNFWKKILSDGVIEIGTDSMIKNGHASWTNGRQDITSVEISNNGFLLKVSISPEVKTLPQWKQYDNYVYHAGLGISFLLSRTVTCSIQQFRTFTIDKISDQAIVLLGNSYGDLIPANSKFLECTVTTDQDFFIRWR